MRGDYLVTVCSSCCTASCWHGRFMCSHAQGAGTVDVRRSTLDYLALEHPSNFSPEALKKITGADPAEAA